MKRNWQPEELIEHWTITSSEKVLLKGKTQTNRLGLAVLLKFYQYEGRFPLSSREIPIPALYYLAKQLNIDPHRLNNYDFQGRSSKVHRVAIRDFLGFREASLADQEALKIWLESQVQILELKPESLS